MSVTHIVQLQFKPSVSAATIQDVQSSPVFVHPFKAASSLHRSVTKACERMLSLKESCIHPDTRNPYIVSSTGGRDCSIEGMQRGITHVFVVEFESTAHRDYYAAKDPAHLEFGASLGPIVENVQVVDFQPGKFTKE